MVKPLIRIGERYYKRERVGKGGLAGAPIGEAAMCVH